MLSLPALAKTTAMYGSTAAEIPKTQVYHPYGWTSTIRAKHAMRMDIVRT